jgi:hypothetical protein
MSLLQKISSTVAEDKVNGSVYLLWFVQEGEGDDDTELLIGVYNSEPAAKAAIERLKDKPGFTDFPDGFQIHRRELGQDSWTEGFVRTS